MKKAIALAVVLVLALGLAACGGDTTTTTQSGDTAETQPSPTPAQDDGDTVPLSAAPSESPTPVPSESAETDTPPAEGTYEGELDANGKYTGWGVWVYHNMRYEGYFENGMPNGEGTLYQGGKGNVIEIVYQSSWKDGYADGAVKMVDKLHDGRIHTYNFEVALGSASEEQEIPAVEDESYPFLLSPDRVYGVPPFAEGISTSRSIPAPSGEETVTAETEQSPPPVSDAADISELVFNEQTMSLSAQINADGTITYTYKDTSIKPYYDVSDTSAGYMVLVIGRSAEGRRITITDFKVESEMDLLDMAGFEGTDAGIRESIPATVETDSNGLSLTWESIALDGMSVDDIATFDVTANLHISGGNVYDEYVTLGSDVLE